MILLGLDGSLLLKAMPQEVVVLHCIKVKKGPLREICSSNPHPSYSDLQANYQNSALHGMLSNSISQHHYSSHLKNRSTTDSCTNAKKFGNKGQKQSATGPSTESNNNLACNSSSKTANGILQQFAQQAAVLALKSKSSRESHNTSTARTSASNEQEVRITAFTQQRWRPFLEPTSC